MVDTTHIKLPLIAASQAQKHVTVNEALVLVDAVVQVSVKDRDLTAPPGSPIEGDRYIVASGGTGAWATWDLNIALYTDGAWLKVVPGAGWIAWAVDESKLLIFNGAAWLEFGTASGLVSFIALRDGTVDRVGVLTAADATNRLAAKTNGVLFSHDDVTPGTGDLRVTLNKSAVGKDAGFVLQDAYSTRALFGLLADDNLAVKVSPDGTVFYNGLTINKDNGAVDHPEGSKFQAYCNFDKYVAANAWTKIDFNNVDHNDQGDFDAGTNTFTAPTAGYYLFGCGFRFKANAAVPTSIKVGLAINGANPLARDSVTHGDATIVTLESYVQCTRMIKLASGQTVVGMAYMSANDGYAEANENFFWGARVS